MMARVFWSILLLSASLASARSNIRRTELSDGDKCSSITKSLDVGNATIWFSQYVTAGTNLSIPDYNVTCGAPYQLVSADICRIAMYVPTSSSSGLSMEAWLPTNWTGRFLSTGNGGVGGCIGYSDLAYTTSLGFSAVGTNNGHNGTSGGAFYNAPEVVEDFAYRAMHIGVVLGKSISKQFYGKDYTKSYYLGCSTGGRQGFKAVQSFPDDSDGVVAGAPAFDFNNLNSWSGHFYPIINASAAGKPPVTAWPAIHKAILEQCDGIDGYVDGIIEDPTLCYPHPESLICPSNGTGNSSTCLTGAQAQTVRALFQDVHGENGTLVYPRLQPGVEVSDAGIYFSGTPFPYSTDWYRYAIYNDLNWNPATLGSADYAYADAKNPGDIKTWNGDLSAFRARGAKVLHYHGQQDQIITSSNSPRYYDHVSQTMSLAPNELDDFYRFFRISGMAHCSGGPGAYHIGNQAVSLSTLNPEENVLMAMVRWVEQGQAPVTITGTAYVNDTKSLGVSFKRAHCRYPYRNVYKGTGDPKAVDSWECIPGF